MRAITFTMLTPLVFICFCLNLSVQLCSHSDTRTIICDNVVPFTLPSNVTRVYINIFSVDTDFNATTFSHKSWRTVTFLDIAAQYKNGYGDIIVTFGSMCFSQIHALKQLRIHGNQIKEFSLDSFDRVEHLQQLQVSETSSLDMNIVIEALSTVNITVETLSLNDILSATDRNMLCLNDLFFELLHKMTVTSLNLRKTIFKVDNLQHRQIQSKHIDTLDISHTNMMAPNIFDFQTMHIYVSFFQGLKTLNISSSPLLFSLPDNEYLNDKIIRNCDEFHVNFQRLIQILSLSVENLYSNRLFRDTVITNNALLNISDCDFRMKTWHFRENKMQYLNISVYLPQNNTLREVDFSNNEIKYLSPLALHTAKSLEILKLTSNELFYMEVSPDFNDLLATFTALRHFSIADNKISNLPRDIFRNNAALELIDLADNRLTSITFTLQHLEGLKSLNIARNRIQFIESKAFRDIQLLFKIHASTGSNQTTVIDMNGNPFICSCDSVEFMEWIITFVQIHKVIKYNCLMENEETEINKDSLAALKLSCYRTEIILGTYALILILVAGAALVIKLILRRKQKQKQNCNRKLFLKDFQKGILREQFLCQIAYSSEDEECFHNIVYPNFNTALRQKLRCKREVICTGDKNFCLGRSIIDEIVRCISESCVIIFVISKSFCESRWCLIELREAYEMGKPIILIFKEEVKTNVMPKLLLTVFNRFTRAKLVENEGLCKLIPDWETLGESIIKVAAENYIAYK